MKIFSNQQINYLKTMDQVRLIEYLNNRSLEELKLIKEDIETYIKNNNLSIKEKDEYLTILSCFEAKINGLRHNKEEDQTSYIDISKFKPLASEKITEILGLTIKKDDHNKLITFFAMLSAYTAESQFNISFNAPSSSGKSYIPIEIAELFPKEDVVMTGYCSPTAFFHDYAKQFKKETNELLVDFENKVIIFLDQPHTLLLEHLRPILSHDKKEIKLKITDKSQKGGLRTKNILVRGYSAVIFCSAKMQMDEQESTRFILLSPEISQEKIRKAIDEKLNKEANINDYKYDLELNEERKLLKERILAIKQEKITEIVIKETEKELIKKMFLERVKIFKLRHSRDIGRICSLIKVFALINLWFRGREGSMLIVNKTDVKEAFKLWDTISASQELNVPPYLFNLYNEVIVSSFEEKNSGVDGGVKIGLTRQEILKKHYQVYGRHLSDWQLRKEILPMLETSGLIIQEPDKDDKRKMLVYPTTLSTISRREENIVEEMVGEEKIDFDKIPF